MPTNVVHSAAQEKDWEEAKDAAKGEKKKGDNAFYGTTMKIYENKIKAHGHGTTKHADSFVMNVAKRVVEKLNCQPSIGTTPAGGER